MCKKKQNKTKKSNQAKIGVETSDCTQGMKNIPHEKVLKELGLFSIMKQRLSRSTIV